MIDTTLILSNESELFARLSNGDRIAFTNIFEHYEPRLYPFVLKITRSEIIAEEIIQELFIKLWTDYSKAADITNPRAYIFKMATNRTVNYLRGLARNAKLVSNAACRLAIDTNSTEELIDYKETQELIYKAIEQLPDQQKKVYLLNRQKGLSTEEIATQLNLSPKTVRNHLTEALHRIKKKLQYSSGTATALIIFLVKNVR